MKNDKKPFDPLSLSKLGFLGDRWPFILLAVIISVVVIMTSGLFGREEGSAQYTGVDEYNFVKGKVLTVDNSKLSEDPYIEGMMLGSQPITVEIMAGAHKGERFDVDNVMSRGFNISTKPGQVILLNVREENGVITGVDVFGYNRDYTLYILIGVFLAVLIFIGRKKGLYSSISLIFTLIIVVFFLVPRILAGDSPILVAMVTTAITTAITIFIVSGWNIKSFAAILGIVCGVLVAALTAMATGYFGNLNGLSMSEASEVIYLAQDFPLDVPQLLVAGIIIASLGAIMDVGITISSSIFEVKAADRKLGMKALYRSGMNVGRDAMGTMSNTLILAFAGSSLNVLIIIILYNMPYLRLINLNLLGVELLQGLSGSIGLTLTVPLTAIFAASFAAKAKKLPED